MTPRPPCLSIGLVVAWRGSGARVGAWLDRVKIVETIAKRIKHVQF
jgi:hypothetical protein